MYDYKMVLTSYETDEHSTTVTFKTYSSELQQRLITEILKLSKGFTDDFLRQFDENDLEDYLIRLWQVSDNNSV